MEIIAFSGYARSGKDEAANELTKHGFIRVAFADKLREVLYQLNPLVFGHNAMPHEYGDSEFLPFRKTYQLLQDVIDEYGWDGYKATVYGPEIRRLLQRLGTEAGRQTLWDSIWIDAALTGLSEDARVVVTDVRFPNEFNAIRERGGLMVRIHRDGVGPAAGADGTVHVSETSLDDFAFDYHINNDGTLEEFHSEIRRLFT